MGGAEGGGLGKFSGAFGEDCDSGTTLCPSGTVSVIEVLTTLPKNHNRRLAFPKGFDLQRHHTKMPQSGIGYKLGM
jgi:hypothetical protein